MLAKLRKDHENEEGFTLIELLVVVIIIGILAAIAIPVFLNQRQRAYQAGLTSDIRNATLEIEAQATNANGAYPAAPAGTFEVSTANTAGVTTTLTYYPYGTNAFCLQGVRSDLDGGMTYESAAGGLGAYAEPAPACPAAIDLNADGDTADAGETRGAAAELDDSDV